MPLEQLIEQFVRFPDCLSQAMREKAGNILLKNPEAAEIAAYYREYYGMLDEVSEPRSRGDPIM